MYQFPKWKYWLVIIVLVVGVIFFIPNLFGQAPALQLTRNDRQAMDEPAQQSVLKLMQDANIPVEASYLDNDRLVLRFETDQQQIAAHEVINQKGDGRYLVALADVPRTPAFIRKLGLKPMSLGLDLRGGVNFVYEVDIDAAVQQALERIERDARTVLRDKRIPYNNVTTQNGVVRVALRNGTDLSRAMDALKSPDGSLLLTSETAGEGANIDIRMSPAEIKRRQDQAVQQNITTLRNRVDELGVSEPIIARQAVKRIGVQLPGVKDPNEAIRVLGATATVEFRLVDENNDPYAAQATKRIPIGSKLYKMSDGRPILLKRDVIATGEQLTDAQANFSQGEPEVSVTLDARGGQEMLRVTRENVGRRMAVVYLQSKHLNTKAGERCEGTRVGDVCNEEKVINAATIQSVLSSRFRITGLQATEARELALLLRSGALAAPQTIVEQRSVGPSLGQDNIDRGIHAMVIGLVLTFVFMAIYYRGFGWIANAVLLANLVLTVGLLSMLQISLSLPGIAAVVFHLGIAVDANILIYERIREELRAGNSPLAAINAGFEKAFATIADSNVTTLIAGVVLFAFGSGTIRSFAEVMTLGIVTSLFTSVVGSRALVHAIWGRRRRLESLPI
ncbi:MAG TPA: protein translocase subunit SecD [Steroidobacteraceae bacterium]|nr:protein translocase subunit SecD [Steroidobacteraceae bacterium]